MIIPSKWVILKWWSLWNDIWLSHRKERQRPQSFRNALWLSRRNGISKANCPLHACGVFRVLVDWILTKFNWQEPGWKISLSILSRLSMTIVSKWVAQFCIHFDMVYDCHFEMTAQKSSYRESFSSITVSQFLVTKMPPKPHIFVHRFFRGDCPLAAWKYKS